MADIQIPEIKPKRLLGAWDAGYAQHVHTLSSVFLGYNEHGHATFDTTRSPIGELLYRLKYRNDQTAVEPLVAAVEEFWKTWHPTVDAIVPVPPSVIRNIQPVLTLATEIAQRLHIPLSASCVSKVKQTPQLKNVFEYDKRTDALAGAFAMSVDQSKRSETVVV